MFTDTDHQNNYYNASANQSLFFASLDSNKNCDVCIIGGGYSGLSSALHLSQLGFSVTLLEANKIGWGASGRNGGQVCSGFNKSQEELEAKFGFAKAKRLWQIGEEAKALIQSLIKEHKIECDYASGILHAAYKVSELDEFKSEVDMLRNRFDYKEIEYLNKTELRAILDSPIYHGGQYDKGAGHLHPLNFTLGMAKAAVKSGVDIYQDSEVIEYAEHRGNSNYPVKVSLINNIAVNAKYVVLATNGYLGKLDKSRAAFIMPINNFILATEPLGDQLANQLIANNAAVSDSKFVVNYYRLSADRRLIYGGGENYSAKFPTDIKAFVRPHMLKTFPQLESTDIDYAWGGTLAITMNRLPDFGEKNNRIYHMLGYSGQGIALAIMAGKLVAEKIKNKSDDFDLLSSLTSRKFPGGTLLRRPGQILGMLYYSAKDRFGQ